jgi:hypothetical protein
MPLATRERAILDFERDWWAKPGAKERRIRDQLGLSPTRYYTLLAELLDSDEAMTYDPLLIRRLRRDREQRRRARWEAGGSR